DLPNNPRLGRCEAPGLGNPYSDMTPVEAVVDGTFDAAVANERRFLQVAAREKLVLLARFQDTGSVLVRRSGLSSDVAATFQRAITALSETQILQLFPGNSGAFAACDDRDFARLRSKLRAESRFDENSFANETSATNQQLR